MLPGKGKRWKDVETIALRCQSSLLLACGCVALDFPSKGNRILEASRCGIYGTSLLGPENIPLQIVAGFAVGGFAQLLKDASLAFLSFGVRLPLAFFLLA